MEQSLNAINPAAAPDNQRIFSFVLLDREDFAVRLEDDAGRKISSTLVLNDLFSFDVIERAGERLNMEALFGGYEFRTKQDTLELLRKLRDAFRTSRPKC